MTMSSSGRTWPGEQPRSPRQSPAGERTWTRTAANADQQNLAPRDREVLEFAAAHPFIRRDHAKALLGDTLELAAQRLSALAQAGLLARQPAFHGEPDSFQIAGRGLEAIDSQLRVPRYEIVRSYRHEYAVAFLALAAQNKVWGEAERVLTQRQMRALDKKSASGDHVFSTPRDHRYPPFGVQLDRDQPDRARYYPDVMLILPPARVAIELQELPPEPAPLSATIAAYGADPNIAVALYLVTDPAVGKIIQAAAASLGLSDPTHVQPARFGANPPAEIAQ
jgi:hypothetical protein